MSQHFQRREFSCPHCGATFVRPALQERLEKLRSAIGRPIPIVSGYRCPVHNRQVGGAANSQHVYAAAADLPAHLATVRQAQHAGFTGIGISGDWAVHVDVRDGPATTWHY